MTLLTGGTLRNPPAGGGAGGPDPGALQRAQNLNDLPDKPAARGFLGLGTIATHPVGDFDTNGAAAAAAASASATAIATANGYADANKAVRLTPTAVKVAAYNAAAGQLVVTDATAASFAVTLPAAPANGTTIGVLLATTGGAHTVTIAAGGADVIDSAGTTQLVLRLPNSLKVLTYQGGTWYTAGGNLSLSQLDGRFAPLAGSGSYETAIVHGVNPNLARPPGAAYVHWVGDVAPANAAALDKWTDVPNRIERIFTGGAWQPLTMTSTAIDYDEAGGAADQATGTASPTTITGTNNAGLLQCVVTAAELALSPTVRSRYEGSMSLQGPNPGRIAAGIYDNGVPIRARSFAVHATNLFTLCGLQVTWQPNPAIDHTVTVQVLPAATGATGVTIRKNTAGNDVPSLTLDRAV